MKTFRNLLGVFLWACALIGVLAWWILMLTICRAPSVPNTATKNIVEYHCHGSTLYITPLQEKLLYGLVPGTLVVAFVADKVRKWPRNWW